MSTVVCRFFSEHSRGSVDPAIGFVVSVALGKVPNIIQIGSVSAELGHLVDRTRICESCFEDGKRIRLVGSVKKMLPFL